MGEHRDVFQEIFIRIAEEYRRRRHPGEDNRVVRWPTIEIERRNTRSAERGRGNKHVVEPCRERRMRRDSLWASASTPQSQYRLPHRTNPEECDVACRLNMGQPQADGVAVKRNRSIQIRHAQVGFKEVVNGNH